MDRKICHSDRSQLLTEAMVVALQYIAKVPASDQTRAFEKLIKRRVMPVRSRATCASATLHAFRRPRSATSADMSLEGLCVCVLCVSVCLCVCVCVCVCARLLASMSLKAGI